MEAAALAFGLVLAACGTGRPAGADPEPTDPGLRERAPLAPGQVWVAGKRCR